MNEMHLVRRVFVEKREEFAIEANEILKDLQQNLGMKNLVRLRLLNRYDISGVTQDEFEKALPLVFSEPPVDRIYRETADLSDADAVFAIQSLPGQYDQRADSAAQCVQILTCGQKPLCSVARVIALYGKMTEEQVQAILDYLINPVESWQVSLDKPDTLEQEPAAPADVPFVAGFAAMTAQELETLRNLYGFAMSSEDLLFTQTYFREEKRDPTLTELRVLDTYWSDHCRHTTFLTHVRSVCFEGGDGMSDRLQQVYADYLARREQIYGDRISKKPVCLMDLATLAAKDLKRRGLLADLDESEEINACSIRVPVRIGGRTEEYLVMFKNETHNHPTEIEPFGGAATCLGGAIRDPLSGRSYVYQAMRVTGSGDPTVPLSQTLPGKLSQRKITTKAAAGYSSYGNQIGLATGQVEELYHPGYIAKRMEIGAVIAAAPAKNVVRKEPCPGDLVILLGGRTGRDGCGGATGSSKAHNEESIRQCGSEVQKGNPPTERKIQRLFRNPEVSTLIKRCNDFGAGGVCVAIGELAPGLRIFLDKVPKKYEGLDGTELAISESQERMAVVVTPEAKESFLAHAAKENLEAVHVATVTAAPRMEMIWRGKTIVDLSRAFIDTNGASQETDVKAASPDMKNTYFNTLPAEYLPDDFTGSIKGVLASPSCCSRKGLVERFDGSIGANSVLMPFGGKTQESPETGMAARIPVPGATTQTASLMTFGFDPYLSSWSPFHGAYYAVAESLSKIAAMGGDPLRARLTFQEYFERVGFDSAKWGAPFAALLGAYQAQLDFGTPAIGGKDSMSGTFRDLHVPPTLVSFAVGIADSSRVLSACFQKPDRTAVWFPVRKDPLELPLPESLKAQYEAFAQLASKGVVLSASTVKAGGLAAAVAKMAFGNRIGFAFNPELSMPQLFLPGQGGILAELDTDENSLASSSDIQTLLRESGAIVLGKTCADPSLSWKNQSVSLEDCRTAWESFLEPVFPTKAAVLETAADFPLKAAEKRVVSKVKTAKPRVFIPVFPGTNCEYDTAASFERAGAETRVVVFKNLSARDIQESIQEMRRAISEANILMIPGGFSGGDEPDGSGKFIATAFRNPFVAEEIESLLAHRDGLILGICNGFQALIKLGLLPFGEIRSLDETYPTLTFNAVGRHASTYVTTKIISNRSPWLMNTAPGDLHSIPVSHGEGRFIASEAMIAELAQNGQIATQYVDPQGKPSYLTRFNPNGSMGAIEGITSLDGRIFGKMGHSERMGQDVAKNIAGDKDQKIFESGVAYFR